MSQELKNKQIRKLFKKLSHQILNPTKKTVDEIMKYGFMSMTLKSKISTKIPNPLIIIEGEEYKTYLELAYQISQEPLAEHLEKKQIDEILERFVNKILMDPDKFKKPNILDKEIEETIQNFLMPFKEWYAISPIDGLEMNFKKISIKNHQIKKFLKREKSIYFGQTNQIFEKYLNERFIGKYCIIVSVKSNNENNALEKGKEKIKDILNSIMIFCGSSSFCKVIDPTSIVVTEKKTKRGSYKRQFNKSIRCEIQKSESIPLRRFMSILSPILNTENPNEFEERIMKGVNWLGIAIRNETSEDKISKFFTGLESLLIPEKNGRKGELLAWRTALLQARINKKFTFPDRTLELYNKRSEIVHGNTHKKNSPNKQDVSSLEYLSITVIMIINKIHAKMNFSSTKEFLKWLENNDNIEKDMRVWINNKGSKELKKFLSSHV